MQDHAEPTIYYLADDFVADWLPGFLSGLRRYHPSTRVVWIPFSSRTGRAAALAGRFGVERFSDASLLGELDRLGTSVMGDDSVAAHMFRRLAAHFGGARTFVSLDTDVLVRSSLDALIRQLQRTGADLLYCDQDAESVFLPTVWHDRIRAEAEIAYFNAGCFAARALPIDLGDLRALARSLPQPASTIFAPTGDQPFYNLVAARQSWKVEWAGAAFETIVRAGSSWRDLRQRAVLHWAGWPLALSMPHAGRYAVEVLKSGGAPALRPIADAMLLRHSYRWMRYPSYRRRLRALRQAQIGQGRAM